MNHMKIAAGLILAVFLMAAAASAAPRLTIPESMFDFGFVPQNSKVAHVFWLHSTGDDTLKIVKVNPG
jgi:predicted alpha/beta hydrolase family esterase